MKNFEKILKKIIDKCPNGHNIEISITGWIECGEFDGDDPRPIGTIKLVNNIPTTTKKECGYRGYIGEIDELGDMFD
jgi:hypothetical protein